MAPRKPRPTEDDIARRRARVLSLRAAGLSPAQIARQEAEETSSPPRSVTDITADIQAALNERKNSGDGARSLQIGIEVERLDAIQRIMETVLRGSTGGRCGACGRGGDPSLAIKASQTLLRVGERRANLVGLDAKYGVEPEKAPDKLDELRARRDQKLKALDG
jgi:low affinity Fe/Cu permease